MQDTQVTSPSSGEVWVWHAEIYLGKCNISKCSFIYLFWNNHAGPVKSCVFSSDGQLFASASHDCTVRIWCSSSTECTHILTGVFGFIWALAGSRETHIGLIHSFIICSSKHIIIIISLFCFIITFTFTFIFDVTEPQLTRGVWRRWASVRTVSGCCRVDGTTGRCSGEFRWETNILQFKNEWKKQTLPFLKHTEIEWKIYLTQRNKHCPFKVILQEITDTWLCKNLQKYTCTYYIFSCVKSHLFYVRKILSVWYYIFYILC